MPRTLLAAALALATLPATAQSPVEIHVDLAHSLGPYTPITSWFGYDEANYTTTPDGHHLLRELHDAYTTPVYIRAHHLLTTGNGTPELKWSSTNVYSIDANGHPVYDFKILDHIFDAYRDAGVRPMVELGFMPEALASGPAPYQTHYPHTLEGSSQSPPKDYAAWGELCRTLTAHLVSRYGVAETSQWYFEVWNEPDIAYWHGTEPDYEKLYDYAVAGVRSALPNARVGGPASTGPANPHAAAFLQAFLQHVATGKSAVTHQPIPLDFISFHVKGRPKLIPSTDDAPTHVQMGLDKELVDAGRGFSIVASFPQFQKLPIILSEADPEGCAACSAKENPANAYRNGPLYPAYTAASMKSLIDLAERNHVNLISMLTWSFEFEGRDTFEGFRTLSTNRIDKPILNFFRMAAQLGGDRVETTSSAQIPLDLLIAGAAHADPSGANPDIDAFATRTSNSAAILLWNYHDDDLPAPAATVTLHLDNLPINVHRLHVEHLRIDSTHSNAYTLWQTLGSPAHPTPAQLVELQTASQLQPLTPPETVEVIDNTITLTFDLPRQATSLLHLTW